jgi:eukaryotic-like serine/threonine-protein kinase
MSPPDSRYRITERIAAGGMAEVFRGVAESIQGFRKNVAIKRVLPALTKNKKFVAMFLDEARLSLHLQHANIVQVFDIGHTEETYFIVMEYVDGIDLKMLLEWRRRIGRLLTIGQTVYLIMEASKGLAYAHEAVHPETGRPLGIVHRDVSPPNVLISRNGEVKVTDFGLAKAAVQVETTDPGVVKGKMSYLSPEAARGEEVDRRADIFAVGILLYEMLTGKRLFYGETDYQTVELVRASKIPPIAPQNPEVEGELEEIVRKSLARRPDDRFQSATDLQDALAHYLFSRGLKMIQRDISDLVRSCIDDQQGVQSPVARKPKANVIDTLLQDEIQSFTSVEFDEKQAAAAAASGFDDGRTVVSNGPFASPLPPMSSGEYIDPRSWADDTGMNARRPAPGAARANPPEQRPGPMPTPPARPAAPPPAQNTRPAAPPPAQNTRPPASPRATPSSAPSAPQAPQGRSRTGSSPRVNEPGFNPTPSPERLAEVLEPGGQLASGNRRMTKGMVAGILVTALVLGVVLANIAAWLLR